MKIIRNKRGSGLPTVIAITTLLLGTAATLMVTAIQQSQLVEKNIQKTEEYTNAVYRVDASMQIIMRELNLDADYLKDPANVQAIEEYLNVSISQNASYTLFSVSQVFTENQIINSYLSTTGEVTLPEEEQGDIINYLPITDISQPEEMVINTTTSLMDIYTEEHNLDPIDYQGDVGNLVDALKQIDDPLSFDVINSFKEYQEGGTITGSHLIFNGTLVLKAGEALVVEDGYILFIFGNFNIEAGATFKGNVMVTGSVDFKTQKERC